MGPLLSDFAATASPIQCVTVLNSTIHVVDLEQATDEIVRWIHTGERGWVCTINVAILMQMRENPRLQRYADAARLVQLVDGALDAFLCVAAELRLCAG